jgi:hypothetical protein
VVDGTDNQPTSGAQQTGDDRELASAAGREKPVSFDFKLRLGSREETSAQLSGRATGELVQLQPIDWDALVAPPADEPRSYQTDGDLQSIIVQLANQIAGPETRSNPVVHVTASATIETARPAAPTRVEPSSPVAEMPVVEMSVVEAPVVDSARPAAPVLQPVPKLAPLPIVGRPVVDGASDATIANPAGPTVDAVAPEDVLDAGDSQDPLTDGEAGVDAGGGDFEQAEGTETAEPVEGDTSDSLAIEHPTDDAALVAAAAAAVAAHATKNADAAPVAPRAPAVAATDPGPPPASVRVPAPPAPTTPLPPAAPVPVVGAPVEMPAPVTLPVAAPETIPAPAAVVQPVVQMVSAEAAMASTAAPAPAAPAAPVAPLSLARIERKPNAERPTKPVDFHALLGQAGLQQPAVRRRKKRHPFRMLFKLVVLLGIVGAGLYFGKIYVLDKRWDAELKPFAEAVSTERELEWKHAVKMETLPADEYGAKLATGWLGITEIELDTTAAEWRAMGLAEGRIEAGLIGSAAMSSRPVYYDPVDEKIYELDGLPDELRELALDRALTMALLDQHYDWSSGLAELDPAERTAVRALFDGDALSTSMAIVDPGDADSAELVDQMSEIVAEHAEDAVGAPRYAVDLVGAAGGTPKLFDAADGVTGRDELLRSEPRSDAAVLDAVRGLDDRPADLGGELTETRGLLYWYYVLAGRLTPTESWDAALAWDGDKVVVSETANGVCVEATIATIDEQGRLRLLDALQRWAAASPVEAGTTVTEIGTEQLSVFSCDPGPEADTVLNDQIETFGESVVELTIAGDLEARTDAERACVVNAVRAFDVPAIIATGDPAQIDPALEGIGDACVG